jgi:hypothetical protein
VERVGISRGPHLQGPEVPVDVSDVRRNRRFRVRRPRVQQPARGVSGLPPFPRLLRLGLNPRRRPRSRLRRPRRRVVVHVRSAGRGELGHGLALPPRPIERRRRVRGDAELLLFFIASESDLWIRIRSSDCFGFPLGFAGFGSGRAMSEAPAFVWGPRKIDAVRSFGVCLVGLWL